MVSLVVWILRVTQAPENLQSTLIFKAGRHSGLRLARLTAEREYSLLFRNFLQTPPCVLIPREGYQRDTVRKVRRETSPWTRDAAATPWPQIHQGGVTFEFTEVIHCSKTRRLFLEGRPCYLIKDRKWTRFFEQQFFFFFFPADLGRSRLLTFTAYKHLGLEWPRWNRVYRWTRKRRNRNGHPRERRSEVTQTKLLLQKGITGGP